MKTLRGHWVWVEVDNVWQLWGIYWNPYRAGKEATALLTLGCDAVVA